MTAAAERAGAATSYDETPYLTHIYPQSHPDRLATHAALFGIPYAPVETCRVLEIACGDAANLVSLALTHPEARFVGFDLAPTAIERGRSFIDTLGLTNITLHHADIRDAHGELGEFDYVIAHGVYAWIPRDARDALLALIRRTLAPAGVGFVSYNALPGCRVRQVLRDMLRFALRDIEGAAARAKAIRQVLGEIAEALPSERPFSVAIREEARSMLRRPLALVAHDELGEVYHPVHLFEFLDHCAHHGLRFLTEAESRNCADGFIPTHALDDAGYDVAARAQEADFAMLRCFHQTLVVREDLAFSRRPRAELLFDLHVATPAKLNKAGEFEVGRQSVEIEDEALSAAVGRLGAAWPASVPVSELLGEDEERALALLNMYWLGAVELHVVPLRFMNAPGPRPAASPLARLLAKSGATRLLTLRQSTVEFQDEFSLEFIAGLDGSRTVEELVRDVCVRLDAPVDKVGPAVEANLGSMARIGLLVQ